MNDPFWVRWTAFSDEELETICDGLPRGPNDEVGMHLSVQAGRALDMRRGEESDA